jgi:hypothetical protein
MNPPADPGPGFSVSISTATAELLRQLHDQAAADGLRDRFLAALQRITDRLSADPVSFGEELFDLPAMHLTLKVAVVLPIAVEFGVYLDRRMVFVRTFRYLPPA